MKIGKIVWGLMFILMAVLIVLDAFGVISPLVSAVGEISVFVLIGVAVLLVITISLCIKGKVSGIFFPLAFIFMLIEGNIAVWCGFESTNIIHNGLVLLIALLLTIGFGMLSPRKRKKGGVFFEYNGGKHKKGENCAGGSIGSHVVYVDCERFYPDTICNNMGECTVHFENVEIYDGDRILRVDNNLGAMTINVPSEWRVLTSIDNSLGNVDVPVNAADSDAPVLYVEGENNLGAITFVFV